MAPLKKITKSLLISGLLFGALGGLPAVAAAHEGKADMRQSHTLITTTGSGEVRVSPDAFRTTVGVEARARTLDQARNEVNTKAQQMIQAIRALDIANLTLQTESVRVNPIYKPNTTPPVITGYSATNQVSVTVVRATPTDLGEYASRIVDTALRSGANRVGDISFFLEDTTAAQDQALKAAVNDAAHNAQVIAEAGGVRIIKLQAVDQGFTERPTAYLAAERAAAPSAGPAPTPIEVGKIVLSSSVTARFVFSK